MSVFAILFWCWFIVSVVVLVRRRVAKRAARKADEIAPTTPQADRGPTAAPTPVAAAAEHPAGPAPEPRPDPPAPDPQTHVAAPAEREPVATASPSPPPGHPARGIADALDGIRLPCDLAPLTIGVADLEPDHVDLVTTGVGADRVGRELAGELERLGYDLSDVGAGEYLARRGDTVVRVKIHDRPALSVGADGRGFATAPSDGIVVELNLT